MRRAAAAYLVSPRWKRGNSAGSGSPLQDAVLVEDVAEVGALLEFRAGAVFAADLVGGEFDHLRDERAGDDDHAVHVGEHEVARVHEDLAAFYGEVVSGDDAAAHRVDGFDAGGEDREV